MQHKHRRYFLTLQGLGAANDNLVKQAILVMIGFGLITYPGEASLWTNLASALFILPFLLFSVWAGRWVAVRDLRDVIRWIKTLEIVCAVLAGAGLVLENLYLLLGALTLLGIQSTLFGPSKFSWPARTEPPSQLPSVTGSIEAITFIAILLGSLVGGLMVSTPVGLALLVISLAVVGRVLAQYLPSVPAISRELPEYTDQPQTLAARRLISWFWFLGASYLTQLPLLADGLMQIQAEATSSLLAAFAIGVGIGSKLASRWTAHSLTIGLWGLIALGISLPFAATASFIAGLINLAALGVMGGLYVVPLYVWMQTHLSETDLPQAIGANNRLNAVLMVLSAGFGILTLVVVGLSPTLYFVILASLSLLTVPAVIRFQRYSGS